MEFFKPGKTYDFMGMRRFWTILSISLVVISTILTFYPGPNYGTDFRGGTEIELALKKNVDAAAVRAATERAGFSSPDVVQVSDDKNPSHFLIRVQEVSALDEGTKDAIRKALCFATDPKTLDQKRCPEENLASEVKFSAGGDKLTARYDGKANPEGLAQELERIPNVKVRVGTKPQFSHQRLEVQLQSKGDQLLEGLRTQLGADVVPEQALRVEWVGPKAGKQLRDSARNSVIISIVFIMLYLAFRFDVRFAPGVVLACVHDAMVVIGVFIALHKEITLSTIAAVLTIVGYSMNDTVVVYDRIRENLSKHRGKSFGAIINLSVSETLSRTLLTSGATMLSVLAFFIWGTGVIKDFALAMVVGIVAGTYSSIYVAAPLTEWIDQKMANKGDVKRRLTAKAV
jgi:preprotein translocase subunit SecF